MELIGAQSAPPAGERGPLSAPWPCRSTNWPRRAGATHSAGQTHSRKHSVGQSYSKGSPKGPPRLSSRQLTSPIRVTQSSQSAALSPATLHGHHTLSLGLASLSSSLPAHTPPLGHHLASQFAKHLPNQFGRNWLAGRPHCWQARASSQSSQTQLGGRPKQTVCGSFWAHFSGHTFEHVPRQLFADPRQPKGSLQTANGPCLRPILSASLAQFFGKRLYIFHVFKLIQLQRILTHLNAFQRFQRHSNAFESIPRQSKKSSKC